MLTRHRRTECSVCRFMGQGHHHPPRSANLDLLRYHHFTQALCSQPSCKAGSPKIIPDWPRRKQMVKIGQNRRSWPQDDCSSRRWSPIVFWSMLNGHHTLHCSFHHNKRHYAFWAMHRGYQITWQFICLVTIRILRVDFLWCHLLPPFITPGPNPVGAQSEKAPPSMPSGPPILSNFPKVRAWMETFITCWFGMWTPLGAMKGRKEAWSRLAALKILTTRWEEGHLQATRHENDLRLSCVTLGAFRDEP